MVKNGLAGIVCKLIIAFVSLQTAMAFAAQVQDYPPELAQVQDFPSEPAQNPETQNAPSAEPTAPEQGSEAQTVTPDESAAPEQEASAKSSETPVLEEIVVTARRKQENLQEVPTAVTAIGAEEMANLKIENFGDVGKTVPNLSVQKQFGSASAPAFFLRGVASGLTAFQTDSGVGLYIDGVYLGRSAGVAFDLADMERLEVMRGPQGTLFGRNSTGGALNFVTAAPTGNLESSIENTVGAFGAVRTRASVNLPQFSGISSRVTVLYNEHDGYVTHSGVSNTYTFSRPFGTLSGADQFGNDRTKAIGVALSYAGIKDLTVDYKFDYADKKSTQLGAQALATYAFTIGRNPDGTPIRVTPQQFIGFFGASGFDTISLRRLKSLPIDTGTSPLRVEGHSLTAEYVLAEHLSVKNILSRRGFQESTGFNDIDGNNLRASDGSPFAYIASMTVQDQRQWSDELQFLGDIGNFDWIAGAFWFDEKGRADGPVFIDTTFTQGQTYTPGVTNGSALAGAGINDYSAGFKGSAHNNSIAGYAHGTYHLGDLWDLSAGLRHTQDDRQENIIRKGALVDQNFSNQSSHTDWDASATYKVMPHVNVYGKVATSYLSGGTFGGQPFEPEDLTSYELGSKADLLDRSLRLNTAVFRASRQHLQLPNFNTTQGLFIADGGQSTQDGVEAELTYLPIEDLVLAANYGYILDKLGNNLRSLQPKHTAYASADYQFMHFAGGSYASARADVSWRSDITTTPCPVGTAVDPKNGCQFLSEAYPDLDRAITMKGTTQLGARLSLQNLRLWGNTGARVSLWGTNLLDTKEFEFARDLGNGLVIGNFQTPRSFGLDLGVDFY